MDDETRALLDELAQTATDLGSALAPVGHVELLQSITDTARTILNAAACSLALLDEAEEHLTFFVASGAGAGKVVGTTVPVGKGIAGWVVSSGQPIVIGDLSKDPRFDERVAAATGYVPRSILAMPLETERRMIGAIEVLDPGDEGSGAAGKMDLLAVFARQAALAIENSRVFTDLGRSLVESLARVAEDRSLKEALMQTAGATGRPNRSLATLAAHFNELGRLGDAERAAATALVGEFLSYVGARS